MSYVAAMILQVAGNVFFAACVIFTCKRSFCWPMRVGKKWIPAIIFLVLGICAFFLPSPIGSVSDFLTLAGIFILGEGKVFERLINLLIAHFGLELFQFVFVNLKVLATGLDSYSAVFFTVINLLLLLAVLFTTSRKWYQRGAAEFRSFSLKKRLFILGLFIVADVLSAIGSIVRDKVGGELSTALFVVIMIFMLIGIVGGVVWLLVESRASAQYKEQARLKEEIIVSQKMYYQAMLEKEQELRAFRHDIGNQLGVLGILYEKGDQEEFVKQLRRLLKEYENTGMRHVSVGDEVLDAILNTEFDKAARMGVRFQVTGRAEDLGAFDVYDLCAIFSNSVRNAVEACKANPQESEIDLTLKIHNDTFYYRIENPATEEEYQCLMEGKTSKEDGERHGFGVRNVKMAVERMNGRLEYRYQDHKVILEIFA